MDVRISVGTPVGGLKVPHWAFIKILQIPVYLLIYIIPTP